MTPDDRLYTYCINTIMSFEPFQDFSVFLCENYGEAQRPSQCKKGQEQILTNSDLRQQKLIQNKISAKNSRDKKKKYLQQLEKSQAQLVKQIAEVDKQLQKTKEDLDLILKKKKENDSFNSDQKPTYERLKHLIRQQNSEIDEDEATMLIQLLINRIGVTGKQRRRTLQYYTKRLVNFSLPAIYRYVLRTSIQNKGLFSDTVNQDEKNWDTPLLKSLKITPDQRSKLFQLKNRILSQKKEWLEAIDKIQSVRQNMYGVSTSVQKELLSFRNVLSVKQVGEFITCLENRKYYKELSYQLDGTDRGPEKKVKLDL